MSKLVQILMTRAEAAEALSFSVRTIDRLCVEGVLEKVGRGRRARVRAASVAAYADAREGEQAPDEGQPQEPSIDELFPLPAIERERDRKRKGSEIEESERRREARAA